MSVSLQKQPTDGELIRAFANDPSWTFVRPHETARVELRGYRGDRATRFTDPFIKQVIAGGATPLVGLVPKERPVLCFACDWMHPRGEDCPGTVR